MWSQQGNWPTLKRWLNDAKNTDKNLQSVLNEIGQRGVDALSAATPVDSGVTASSWTYQVIQNETEVSVTWYNSSNADNSTIPVVILLQYGHGTGTGGFVQGRDFINPAMESVFEEFDQRLREVTS